MADTEALPRVADDETLIVVHGPRDEWGHARFTMYWRAVCAVGCSACRGSGCGQISTRGQEFRSDPVTHGRHCRRRVRVEGVDAAVIWGAI